MIKNPSIPVISEARLIDSALIELQTSLIEKLSWLDFSFGKAERFTEVKGKSKIDYPAIYIGSNNYMKLFPDSHIGNFSFFDVEDEQSFNQLGRQINKIEFNAGLIVWFNFEKVYVGNSDHKTIENVKFDVIQVLKGLSLAKSSVRVISTCERVEKVYKNFSNTEVENQYRMRPYGLFRIELNIVSKNICNSVIPFFIASQEQSINQVLSGVGSMQIN